MKKLVVLMILAVTLPIKAQRLSVHQPTDSVAIGTDLNPEINRHLYKAGVNMQRSANYESLTWGFVIASAASFSMIQDKDTRDLVGYGCALAALISKACAISYKLDSGQELKIAAGSLSLSF